MFLWKHVHHISIKKYCLSSRFFSVLVFFCTHPLVPFIDILDSFIESIYSYKACTYLLCTIQMGQTMDLYAFRLEILRMKIYILFISSKQSRTLFCWIKLFLYNFNYLVIPECFDRINMNLWIIREFFLSNGEVKAWKKC